MPKFVRIVDGKVAVVEDSAEGAGHDREATLSLFRPIIFGIDPILPPGMCAAIVLFGEGGEYFFNVHNSTNEMDAAKALLTAADSLTRIIKAGMGQQKVLETIEAHLRERAGKPPH